MKNPEKIVCFLGIALLFCNCAKTEKDMTGSIVGLVSDELTHELQRAKITLTDNAGKKETTETGTDGLYEFQTLTLGQTYGVVAELSGYHSDTIITKVDGRNIRCDFVMKEIALRLSTNSIDISTGNYADFIIYNDSQRDMVWYAEPTADWLTLNKTNGTVQAKGAMPLHVVINREQVPSGTHEAKIVVNSSHEYEVLTLSVTGNQAPLIYTYSGSSRTFTSFQISGMVAQVGIPAYTERGFVYSLTSVPSVDNTIELIKVNGTDQQTYYATLKNLTPATNYYYCAYAKSPTGVFYGNIESYPTKSPTLPTIYTLSASNVFETGATLNGYITVEGDPAYTEKGFVCASFQNPTVEHYERKLIVNTTGTGSFYYGISGLPTTTHYYVAYAITPYDTVYGVQGSFLPSTPYVSVENLGVARYDATANYLSSGDYFRFSRSEANNYCNNLVIGSYDDWRLPTIEELEIMYNNRNLIGGFSVSSSSKYWSISRTINPENNLELNLLLDFSTGNRVTELTIVTSYNRCRCVRTVNK